MNIITKIVILAFIFAILSLLLKSYRAEFVFLLRVFVVMLGFSLIIDYISNFVSELLTIFTAFNIQSEHISLMLNIIATAIVADVAADTLIDVGEVSVANIILLISKFIILFMTMPVLNSLIIFCLKFIT